jgi:hypothetical protein
VNPDLFLKLLKIYIKLDHGIKNAKYEATKFFSGSGVWTQGYTFLGKLVYHLNHIPILFTLVYLSHFFLWYWGLNSEPHIGSCQGLASVNNLLPLPPKQIIDTIYHSCLLFSDRVSLPFSQASLKPQSYLHLQNQWDSIQACVTMPHPWNY